MELSNMNMAQLKALAKENNLRGYSRLRKADLINFINESIREQPIINQPTIDEPIERNEMLSKRQR